MSDHETEARLRAEHEAAQAKSRLLSDGVTGPRPGNFTKHLTDDGWHVSIDGANGEPVYWTEPYTDEHAADAAIDFALRLAVAETGDGGTIRFVDERTVQT